MTLRHAFLGRATTRLIYGAVAAALALTAGCASSGGAPDVADPPGAPAASANPTLTPGVTWQAVLDGTVHADLGAAVYELDVSVGRAGITAVRDSNPDVYLVCYMSVGTWEASREDAAEFPDAVLGQVVPGAPGERYVDVRALADVAPLWEARIDECAAAGFDAIDPDNLDAYLAASGFEVTREDAVAAFEFIASAAHERGLGVAHKNAPSLVADLLPLADFAIVEQCLEHDACDAWQPYVEAGKPVLDVEYPVGQPPAAWCGRAARAGLSLLVSTPDLATPGTRCDV